MFKFLGVELFFNLGRHLQRQRRGRQWQCSLDSDAPDPSHPWEWPPKWSREISVVHFISEWYYTHFKTPTMCMNFCWVLSVFLKYETQSLYVPAKLKIGLSLSIRLQNFDILFWFILIVSLQQLKVKLLFFRYMILFKSVDLQNFPHWLH